MKMYLMLLILLSSSSVAQTLRVATFNVSMEAGNYVGLDASPTGNELFDLLEKGQHQQIRNIAEIIQRVRPDIILLNEFDYVTDCRKGIDAFNANFLQVAQNGSKPIHYPYHFVAPVNTGVVSDVPLNHSRNTEAPGNNTFGFGLYPGQYGMVLLSRFPIDNEQIRTFQRFLWKDMPENNIAEIKDDTGKTWYSQQTMSALRLSSKSHWDIPLKVNGKRIHILASHPTPPVFDGPENRNGWRNHDEIRFWLDYIGPPESAEYIYDDLGIKGGFTGQRFVLLGDLNASPVEGDAFREPISQLLAHPKVSQFPLPKSKAGSQNNPDSVHSQNHTAAWGMMVDYAISSTIGLAVEQNGIFWPEASDELYRLVENRAASSDHRLVWVDVSLVDIQPE